MAAVPGTNMHSLESLRDTPDSSLSCSQNSISEVLHIYRL
jgi:hypothetical protein